MRCEVKRKLPDHLLVHDKLMFMIKFMDILFLLYLNSSLALLFRHQGNLLAFLHQGFGFSCIIYYLYKG